MTTQGEGFEASEFLLSEAGGWRSREELTFDQNQSVKAGDIYGKRTLGDVTSAVKSGGNVGTGTCVLDATEPKLQNLVRGTYELRCVSARPDAATFQLCDPAGNTVKIFSFSGSGGSFTTDEHIKAVVSDGGADFAVGDGFDIAVSPGNLRAVLIDPAAVDGSQHAAGIAYAAVTTKAGQTKRAVGIAQDAEVKAAMLGFGALNDEQKSTALSQLAARGLRFNS